VEPDDRRLRGCRRGAATAVADARGGGLIPRSAAATLLRSAVPAAVLAAGLMLAPAAQAAAYYVQFTGHLTRLADPQGVFGGATTGQSVLATVRIDDAAPGATIRHNVDGSGSQFGVNGPSVASATVRLNGATYAFAGNSSGALNRVNFLRPGYPSYDGVFTNLSGSVPGATTFLSAYATSITVDFLEQSAFADFYGSPLDFATSGPNALNSLGSFRIDYVQGNPVIGDFQVDRIVVSAAAAVPEPAAWSLLIAGFGLVGGARDALLRHRRGRVSRVVAGVGRPRWPLKFPRGCKVWQLVHLRGGAFLRPDPLNLPPPSCLLTVAHARASASLTAKPLSS